MTETLKHPAVESAGTAGSSAVRHPRLILLAILLAWALSVADFYIVNVALPTIGRSLHAGSAELELIVAGYSASYACLLVTGGRLGDRFGRRRLLMLGMASFLLTSLLCAAATTGAMLVTGRVAQGMSAALMAPQVLATIQSTFTGGERQRALGLLGATVGLATIGGQLLGAVIASTDLLGLSWRPAFLLNLPVGALGLFLAARYVPASRSERPQPLDLSGAALLAVAIAALLVPLSMGREEGWPLWCWVLLAIAVAAAAGFAAVQMRESRRGGAPLVPSAVLRSPGMRSGLGVVVPFFIGAGGFFLTMAVTLQAGRGFGPMRAGLTLLPYALGFLAGSRSARRLVDRFGPRVVVVGAVGSAIGFAAAAVMSTVDYGGITPWTLAPALLLIGAAHGLVMIPLFGIILSTVPVHFAGAAGGVLSTTQQLGLSLGAAALGTAFFSIQAARGFGSATAWLFILETGLALATAIAAKRVIRR